MREGSVRYFGFLLIILMLAVCCGRREVPEFVEEKAFCFLNDQCNMGPRYPGSEGHLKIRRYLVRKLQSFGANVSLQQFDSVSLDGDTLNLINIIANYKLDSKKRILLGAHYDTRPWADKDPDPSNWGKPIIGANDGASGVAVLLEVARQLEDCAPPVGVDIVFFDGEDSGRYSDNSGWILGSRHFVSQLKGYKPYAVIIVDMIGEKNVEIKREGFSSAAAPQILDDLFMIASEQGFEEFKREDGVAIIDDHLPFIQAGFNAVDLIDFDYPYWHTMEDTPDKCSEQSLNAVGTVLLEYIWRQ